MLDLFVVHGDYWIYPVIKSWKTYDPNWVSKDPEDEGGGTLLLVKAE